MGVRIGATRRIRFNDPCAAAMRPYFKLLRPLVYLYIAAQKQGSLADMWWLFVIIVIIFLVAILLLLCCIFCVRNTGETYKGIYSSDIRRCQHAVSATAIMLVCAKARARTHTHTHTHTHPFNDPLCGTTQVSRYQKRKNNMDFIEARDSEWQ